MGITLTTVHLLSQSLPLLGCLSDKQVLTLGVQDCHFTYAEIVRFLERHDIPYQLLCNGDAKLTTGFKWLPPAQARQFAACIHQDSLFKLLGFSAPHIHAMDVNCYEGADIAHDLNVPVDDSLRDAFDIIIDGGTLEHVFSTKDALFNLSRMCKIGGCIVSMTPVDWLNHGFFNFNAEIFRDFFEANGFEEVALKYIAKPTHPLHQARHYLDYRPEKLNTSLRPFYTLELFAVHRKLEDKLLDLPHQGRYKRKLWANPFAIKRRAQVLRDHIPWWAKEWIDSSMLNVLWTIMRGKKVRL